MNHFRPSIGSVLGLVVLAAAPIFAAPVPKASDEPVVDRKNYLPQRAYQARPGKVLGIVVSDVVKIMGREGRGSQADALGFSSNGGSYNWMYVPMVDMPQITNLKVRVGEKGEESVVYPKLGMATLKRIGTWGVSNAFTLVEVEVNGGKGAPADEAFVASKITVVEGSKAFPLKVDDCVAKAKVMYAQYQKDNSKKFDECMSKAMKEAIGDKKATGPRESNELMYITWMTTEQKLVVTFQSIISDGVYQIGNGANIDGGDAPAGAKRPPPPREQPGVRWGTQFGIEFGRSYNFNVDGAAVGTKTLSAETFKKELPPPPAVINRRGMPLPVVPGG